MRRRRSHTTRRTGAQGPRRCRNTRSEVDRDTAEREAVEERGDCRRPRRRERGGGGTHKARLCRARKSEVGEAREGSGRSRRVGATRWRNARLAADRGARREVRGGGTRGRRGAWGADHPRARGEASKQRRQGVSRDAGEARPGPGHRRGGRQMRREDGCGGRTRGTRPAGTRGAAWWRNARAAAGRDAWRAMWWRDAWVAAERRASMRHTRGSSVAWCHVASMAFCTLRGPRTTRSHRRHRARRRRRRERLYRHQSSTVMSPKRA
jgi:hypothetical protein